MVDTRRLLTNARRRATGSVLTHCEQSGWYAGLTHTQKEELRQKVLDAFGVWHDVVLDIVKAIESDPSPDGVTNQAVFAMLGDIHGLLTREVTGETIHGGGVPIAAAIVAAEELRAVARAERQTRSPALG